MEESDERLTFESKARRARRSIRREQLCASRAPGITPVIRRISSRRKAHNNSHQKTVSPDSSAACQWRIFSKLLSQSHLEPVDDMQVTAGGMSQGLYYWQWTLLCVTVNDTLLCQLVRKNPALQLLDLEERLKAEKRISSSFLK